MNRKERQKELNEETEIIDDDEIIEYDETDYDRYMYKRYNSLSNNEQGGLGGNIFLKKKVLNENEKNGFINNSQEQETKNKTNNEFENIDISEDNFPSLNKRIENNTKTESIWCKSKTTINFKKAVETISINNNDTIKKVTPIGQEKSKMTLYEIKKQSEKNAEKIMNRRNDDSSDDSYYDDYSDEYNDDYNDDYNTNSYY